MASAPDQGLPLFYTDLMPLSSSMHGDWHARGRNGVEFARATHAVPLLAEEFVQAQRHYPIVFSSGDNPVPLALMGLNEGVNVFLNEDALFPEDFYVPAYIRRYPFMLAKLRPEAEELSLCFDPASDVLGQFDEGERLFDGAEPSDHTRGILAFCESFEQSAQSTAALVNELVANKLLSEGEIAIQTTGSEQPYVYRGFQTVADEAIKKIRGDLARRWMQSGLLPLVYAHIFSLGHMPMLFQKQAQQGKLPPQMAAAIQPVPLAV